MILKSISRKLTAWCKNKLDIEFDMKEIGIMHYFIDRGVGYKWGLPHIEEAR